MKSQIDQAMLYVCSNTSYTSLCDLADALPHEGRPVKILTWFDEQEYRKLAGGSRIKVFWMRLGMYVFYPTWLFFKALFAPRGGVFIVTTNTFFAPGVVAIAGFLRQHKVVHLLYDLYPDAIEVAGKTSLNSWQALLVSQMTKAMLRHCDATVFLGEFLRWHAQGRWGNAKYSAIIDVGIDATHFPAFNIIIDSHRPLKIRYGGQLGYMHEAEVLATCCEAAIEALSDKVSFHFFTSGAGLRHLRKLTGRKGIHITEPRHDANWRETFSEYPIGLASLSPGGATVCLPSKIYGMLAGSQAVLAICPSWSDMGKIITDNDAGWVVNNAACKSLDGLPCGAYLSEVRKVRPLTDITAEFVEQLSRLQREPESIAAKRKNARKAAEKRYGLEALKNQWSKVIQPR